MGSEWKTYSFAELLSNIVDNRGKTCPIDESGLPLIATNCVKNDTLFPVFEKVRYVNKKTYNTWFRGHPEPGDMIFVCKGSPGNVCWTPEPVDFCIAQDMVAIRANESIVEPKFLFALLRSNITQNKILNMHVGTLIPHFKKGDFKNLYLDIPKDKCFQKVIGDIYFNFCMKIELNRKMNETLEAMAQALFKSWFVDFDPVIDNALAAGNPIPEALKARAEARMALGDQRKPLPEDIRQQFPSRFTFSEEMGWIPEGWDITSFGKVSRCFDKKRIPLSKIQREEKKPGTIPYYGATSIMDYIDDWIFDDVYLLIGEDGSVIKEDDTPFIQYIWGKTWVNNHAHVLQGDAGVSTEHLMLFMACQNMSAYVTGAVQLKINQGNMNIIPFLKASVEVNDTFAGIVAPLFEKVRHHSEEIITLQKTRDVLLPKLLSGQLRIPDAEKLLQEAV